MTPETHRQPGSLKDVFFLSRRLDTVKSMARLHADHQIRNGASRQQKGEIVDRANNAIEELFNIVTNPQGNSENLARFTRDWGEETEGFMKYIPIVSKELQNAGGEIYDSKKREDLKGGITDRLTKSAKIGWEAVKLIKKLKDGNERKRLFMEAGTSEQEVISRLRNLGISSACSFVSAGAMITVLGSSIVEGGANPFLGDMSDPKTQLVVAGSYLAHYSLLALNKLESLRLLKSKVHNSPHVTATGLYYLLERANPKVRDITATVTPMIPFFIEEVGFLPSLFLFGPVGTSAAVLRNFGLAGLNAAETALSELWLQWSTREKTAKRKPAAQFLVDSEGFEPHRDFQPPTSA